MDRRKRRRVEKRTCVDPRRQDPCGHRTNGRTHAELKIGFEYPHTHNLFSALRWRRRRPGIGLKTKTEDGTKRPREPDEGDGRARWKTRAEDLGRARSKTTGAKTEGGEGDSTPTPVVYVDPPQTLSQTKRHPADTLHARRRSMFRRDADRFCGGRNSIPTLLPRVFHGPVAFAPPPPFLVLYPFSFSANRRIDKARPRAISTVTVLIDSVHGHIGACDIVRTDVRV